MCEKEKLLKNPSNCTSNLGKNNNDADMMIPISFSTLKKKATSRLPS
jgi:hypothetical protein